MNDYIRTVSVRFNNSQKEYSYLTDIKLAVGDKVVVDTPINGLQIAEISKIRGLTINQQSKATKWIIQRIDLVAYEERMHKAEIAQEIRNRLRQRKEALEETLIYQRLAKDDPEIQKLLDELSKVDPDVNVKMLSMDAN